MRTVPGADPEGKAQPAVGIESLVELIRDQQRRAGVFDDREDIDRHRLLRREAPDLLLELHHELQRVADRPVALARPVTGRLVVRPVQRRERDRARSDRTRRSSRPCIVSTQTAPARTPPATLPVIVFMPVAPLPLEIRMPPEVYRQPAPTAAPVMHDQTPGDFTESSAIRSRFDQPASLQHNTSPATAAGKSNGIERHSTTFSQLFSPSLPPSRMTGATPCAPVVLLSEIARSTFQANPRKIDTT